MANTFTIRQIYAQFELSVYLISYKILEREMKHPHTFDKSNCYAYFIDK